MVIMVIGNGFSKWFKMTVFCILILIFLFFIRFFRKLMNTYLYRKIIKINSFLIPIRFAISKMFVYLEDIDLKDYNLFFLNIFLRFINLSVSIIAIISHIQKNDSNVYLFFLHVFLWVEFCILLSVLIEYFVVKKLFQKSLENYLVKLKDSVLMK